MSTDTLDRGWSLLLPITQKTTFGNDMAGYVDEAIHTDWTGFEWKINYVERDEPYAYQVSIQVGDSRLPDLVAAVTYFEDEPDGRGPTFYVRFQPPMESGGIHHFGDRG